MNLIVKEFSELTTTELYEILKSRAEIFIMEQNINYQDMDDIDYRSLHFFYKDGDKIVAYLRCFYDGDDNVRIGRVLTMTHGIGLGRKLLEESLPIIVKKMKCIKLSMDAQSYAIGFYEKFGFKVVSDEFLEEGIMHVKMEKDV